MAASPTPPLSLEKAETALPFLDAFLRGLLCNILLYFAVWISSAKHSVNVGILATIFPVAAFITLSFKHSVANMYLGPVLMLLEGGGGFVALVYWLIYGAALKRDT